MNPEIQIIRLGGVNCYLVAAAEGFVLIDTGTPEKRSALDAGLESAAWSWNLKPKPDKFGFLFRLVATFIRPREFDTFEPDILVEDHQSLTSYASRPRSSISPGTRGVRSGS